MDISIDHMLGFREEPFMTEALDSRATNLESSDEWYFFSFLRGPRHCTVSFGAQLRSTHPGVPFNLEECLYNLSFLVHTIFFQWRHNITSINSLSFIPSFTFRHPQHKDITMPRQLVGVISQSYFITGYHRTPSKHYYTVGQLIYFELLGSDISCIYMYIVQPNFVLYLTESSSTRII